MIRSFKGIRYLGFATLFLDACNGFVQPKPIGMLRLEYPTPKYKKISDFIVNLESTIPINEIKYKKIQLNSSN